MTGRRAFMWGVMVGLLTAAAAHADVYMYTDPRGVLHFSNAPNHADYRFFMDDTPHFHIEGYRDPARARKFDPIILAAAQRYEVDPALVKAVIRAESDFVPQARSPKGAQGLMQLMPATAQQHRVRQVYDPEDNVNGGVQHLRLLLNRYRGNVRLALAAYNAGEKAVEIYGGIPPYRETRQYVERVLRFRELYARRGG